VNSSTVVIAIVTYRRADQLRSLLPLLEMQDLPQGWRLELLIVDNDDKLSAKSVADDFRATSPVPTRYVAEPRKGVGNARNRALARAGSPGALVFFDDDQAPVEGWLGAFLSRHESDPSAIWVGPVEPALPDELPDWAGDGWPWRREPRRDGALLQIAGDGNLLLPRVVLQNPECVYASHFGAGMGQDTELTYRLTRSGIRIRFCAAALGIEAMSEDRLSARWVLERARSSSEAWGKVLLTHGRRERLRLLMSLARHVVTASLNFVGFVVTSTQERRIRGLRDIAVVRGYVAAIASNANR
jgi:succinoglycan biosynthesis protein ExoM